MNAARKTAGQVPCSTTNGMNNKGSENALREALAMDRLAAVVSHRFRIDRGAVFAMLVEGWTITPPNAHAMQRTLPPSEAAPLLLANVRSRGDDWGDLANATADDLRDALLLAARQLNEQEHPNTC